MIISSVSDDKEELKKTNISHGTQNKIWCNAGYAFTSMINEMNCNFILWIKIGTFDYLPSNKSIVSYFNDMRDLKFKHSQDF